MVRGLHEQTHPMPLDSIMRRFNRVAVSPPCLHSTPEDAA